MTDGPITPGSRREQHEAERMSVRDGYGASHGSDCTCAQCGRDEIGWDEVDW